jgi:putative sterol carrier protein
MTLPFPSTEWLQAYMQDINNSQSYLEAAKNWEGDFYFIIEPSGGIDEQAVIYIDLWHGKCRQVFMLEEPDGLNPAFTISGSLDSWKKVMTKKLDPMQAMMTGKLKLTGNMAIIMRNVRAAKELVESCTRIPTVFPD